MHPKITMIFQGYQWISIDPFSRCTSDLRIWQLILLGCLRSNLRRGKSIQQVENPRTPEDASVWYCRRSRPEDNEYGNDLAFWDTFHYTEKGGNNYRNQMPAEQFLIKCVITIFGYVSVQKNPPAAIAPTQAQPPFIRARRQLYVPS